MHDRRMRDLYNVGMMILVLALWYAIGVLGVEAVAYSWLCLAWGGEGRLYKYGATIIT